LAFSHNSFRIAIVNFLLIVTLNHRLTTSIKKNRKTEKLQDVLCIRISWVNGESQKTPAECRVYGRVLIAIFQVYGCVGMIEQVGYQL
jgi:hypothetical protein